VVDAAVRLLVPWGALVVIFYFALQGVRAVAGTHTFADIGIKLLGNVSAPEWLSYIVGGGAGAYGIKERKLRRDTVERLTGRIKQLEQMIDLARTSSHLTERGTTRPEDKL
jgi:hypothetical protein